MDFYQLLRTIRSKIMQGKLDVDLRFPGSSKYYPSVLQIAILEQDHGLIDYLLEHNADVNMAIQWSEKDAVDLKEKINIRNKYGKRPLESAIKTKNHEIVNKLISAGAYIAPQDKYHNLLNIFTEEGNYGMVECLIHLGFDINNKNFTTGETPMHTAIKFNHKNILELLIQRGADINAKSNSSFNLDVTPNNTGGLTPLHLAITHKNREIVRILLKNSAEYDEFAITLAKNNNFIGLIKVLANLNDDKIPLSNDGTEFIWAVDEREFKIAEKLINHRNLWSSSRNRIFIGKYLELVKYLVENGTNVNEIRHLYRAPLYLAITWKYNEMAKYLIDKGAKLYPVNNHIDTLRLSIEMNNLEIFKYLLENQSMKETYVIRMSLQWALEKNNLEIGKYLINKCNDVNISYNKETTLHRAILNDNLKFVEYFVEKGADVNSIIEEKSLLIISIQLTRNKIAKYLIDNGADVDFDYKGITPLFCAIGKNNIEIVEYLINNGIDLSALINMDENFKIEKFFGGSQTDITSYNFCNGRSALTLAIDLERIEITKYLIFRGINLQANENKSALYLAINNGETEIAKLLIDKGADINYIYKDTRLINSNKSTWSGVTALILAICKHNDQIVKYLLDKGANINTICNDEELLVLAVLYDNQELVNYCINKGIDLNAVVSLQNTEFYCIIDNNSCEETIAGDINAIYKSATALDIVIQAGNSTMFDLLINAGADINKTVYNKDPLHFAVRNNYWHIIEYLIKIGGDVNSVENDQSLLMEAVYCKHTKVVELLLKNKADINFQANSGLTALDIAINEKNYLIMSILLEFGAFSTHEEINDKPVLYLAIENRSYHHAIAIINRGANVNTIYKKKTLLHIALLKGNIDVINFLLAAGFDVNYEDEDKKTAANYDCPCNYHDYYANSFHDSAADVYYMEQVDIHIVKMIIADFYVCKQNRLAVDNHYDQLRIECAEEVEWMKQTLIIPKIKISYYDLLHGLEHKLAERFKFIFRNNDENQIASVAKNIHSSFPLYEKIIYYRAKRIFTRAKFLVQVDNFIIDLFEGLLEADMVPEISKYLSNNEIKIICRYL